MEIRLLGFPVDRFDRTNEHVQAVQRELDVIRADDRDPGGPPGPLSRLVEELDQRFVGYRVTMDMLQDLVERGAVSDDVVIPVAGAPEVAAAEVERLRDLLVEVDRYCSAGGPLLTAVTPADLLAFREWLFDQVIGQLRGASPVPWTEPAPPAESDGEVAPRHEAPGAVVTLRHTGTLDLGTVHTLRDEIFAVHDNERQELVIDLTDVDFIDSVGLSVLVFSHKRFAADDRAMRLVVPDHLQQLFDMTGLTSVLHISPATPGFR